MSVLSTMNARTLILVIFYYLQWWDDMCLGIFKFDQNKTQDKYVI